MLKKVCLLGASAVGKTSLVARIVRGTFSDVYRTTIGVRIERRTLELDGAPLDLILWDLEGDDEFAQVRLGYLRGAAGYLLVADGTRRHTLDTALRLARDAAPVVGDVPFVLLVNKLDRFEEWEITERDIAELKGRGLTVERASAKTGSGIAEALAGLCRALLQASRRAPVVAP
jgi:small GTP-binding protein